MSAVLSTDFVLLGLSRRTPLAIQRIGAAAAFAAVVLLLANTETPGSLPPLWRGATEAAVFFGTWLLIVRPIGSGATRRLERPNTRQLAAESGPRFVAALLFQLYWTMGLLILGLVASPQIVAEYGIASRLMQVLAQPAGFAILVFAPSLTNVVSDRPARSAQEFWTVLAWSALVALALVAFAGDALIAILFGDHYIAIGSYLTLLVFPLLLYYLMMGVNAPLAYSGHGRRYMYAHVAGAVTALLLGATLIPALGVGGAILASIGSLAAVIAVSLSPQSS